MNRVAIIAGRSPPATIVFQLSPRRPVEASSRQADDVVLAAVTHPPRIGEARSVAALIPEVLARYGLDPQRVDDEPTLRTLVNVLA
jgi:hypothetical protein